MDDAETTTSLSLVETGLFVTIDDTLITDYFNYNRHGSFLDGRPWRDQPVTKLARFQVIDIARKIGAKEFKHITDIERDFIAWARG